MNSVPAVIAAISLVVPVPQGRAPIPASVVREAPAQPTQQAVSPEREEFGPYRQFQDSYLPEAQNQVHIEQRVIIRIAPGAPMPEREDFSANIPRNSKPTRYKEKKFKGCIPIEDIAGAEPSDDNRLLLFMRDHHVLSAALERACDADTFYSGFYVARNSDGMLCSKRDRLLSRSGATCQVAQLNRLVAVKD